MDIKGNIYGRFIIALFFILIATTANAYYVQTEQISTDNGLNFPEVTAIESKNSMLLVGTGIGFNVIINGNITSYESITEDDGNERIIGRVNKISSYNNYRSLLASKNFLFEFHQLGKTFKIIKYRNNDISTDDILIIDDYAYFFEKTNSQLLKYDFISGEVSLAYQFNDKENFQIEKILHPFNFDESILLIDKSLGAFRLDLEKGLLSFIPQVSSNIIASVTTIDSSNNIWVASTNGDIICYSIDLGFKKIAEYAKSQFGSGSEKMTCIKEGDGGDICIGTDGGGVFLIMKEQKSIVRKSNVKYNEINCLGLIDNNLLIGTQFYGLVIVRRGNTCLLNENSDNVKWRIPSDVVLSIFDEGNGKVWMGFLNGTLGCFDEAVDSIYIPKQTEKLVISYIEEYDDDRLLLCTTHNDYVLFDKKSGNIDHSFLQRFSELPGVLNNDSILIRKDHYNNYLIFNANGLNYRYNISTGKTETFVIDKDKRVTNAEFFYTYGIITTEDALYKIDYETITSTKIYTDINDFVSYTIDKKDHIWIIDGKDLSMYNNKTDSLQLIRTAKIGFYTAITTDDKNNLWLSISDGFMCKYNIPTATWNFYSKEDFYVDGVFHDNISLFSSTGRLYFLNSSGVMVLNTNLLVPQKMEDKNVICVSVINDGSIIKRSSKRKIILPNLYKQFSVEYMLESFDPTIPVYFQIDLHKKGDVISSVITSDTEYNLNLLGPGRYTLTIQVLGYSGLSESQELISFRVKQPFVLSFPFIIIFVIVLLLINFLLMHINNKLKQRKLEKIVYEETARQKESRISFITGVAHELRTPLSLIYNPLKDIMVEKTIDQTNYNRIERVFGQIDKMTNLVNMILDSSSYSDTALSNRVESVELNDWISKKLNNFSELCKNKGLKFQFNFCNEIDSVEIDQISLEAAFSNVLSNAIKFSDKGTITVSLLKIKDHPRISISDEGRGFNCSSEDLFKRFFREKDDKVGYGLGLPYARTVMRQIGGNITAEHNPEVGSTFNIDLPSNIETDKSLEKYSEKVVSEYTEEELPQEKVFDTTTKTLLFVDDDSDMCDYIKDCYKSKFKNIVVANDGAQALEKISAKLPDVVVSDIMMPNLNGFDLCKNIKTNLDTSHIPVILLTSRTNPNMRATGYKLGADAFLPKPFDADTLFSIIKNQLLNRFEIKRQYSQSVFNKMSEDQTFSAADESFILKLNKFINDNISNPDLDVEMIYKYMAISRSTLFNKMNELLGTSTNKYIRRLRIDAAKHLLEKTDKSIYDIAMDCGFSDSQYLSSVFKNDVGETPSQYRKRINNESPVS